MPEIVEGCLQVRGLIVHSYALLEDEGCGVILIDGGFVGGVARIERELARVDRTLTDVRAILLTHGHLDHTLNLERLREITGAPLWAPKADALHIAGRYPYRGISRICGTVEAVGRRLLAYRPPEVDRWFHGGEMLDFWGGLRVVPLPGHTLGHCGFYSEKRKLLFAGDLFANFFRFARRPPPWFNVEGNRIGQSLRTADELDLSDGGVLPNHCHPGTPDEHRRDLSKLADR